MATLTVFHDRLVKWPNVTEHPFRATAGCARKHLSFVSFVTVWVKSLPCKEQRQKVGSKPVFNSGGSSISAEEGHGESLQPLNPSTSGLSRTQQAAG